MTTTLPAATSARAAARPALYVVGAVASVQTGAALAKQLFPVVGTAGSVALRLGAAAAVMLAVARPRIRAVPRRALATAALFGLVVVAMNLTFYAAISRIPLGVAVTIEFAGPLTLAVITSRRAADLIWIVLAAIGVLLLTGGGSALLDGSLDPVGVLLVLIAAIGWACYIVLSQRLGRALPRQQGLALALAVAALLAAPIGVTQAGPAMASWHVLGLGAGVGLLSTALPAALELAALRLMHLSAFGVLMSLEPAVAALAGFLFLRERLSPLQLLAIGLVCAASAGAAVTAGRPVAPGLTTPAEPAGRDGP